MIAKPWTDPGRSDDPRLRAGVDAERQMAFYLHRAYSDSQLVQVVNGLRLVDPSQPEHDGRPGVCQIDHLLLHPWGAFIVESKSVVGEVSVRDDGSGGDEWARSVASAPAGGTGGHSRGFPSPIQQAIRQGRFLRALLHRHREQLLGKVPTGLRTVAKLLVGSDQRGFSSMPIQVVAAISDGGLIRRVNGWSEPGKPFRTIVCKADLAPERIREEVERHRSATGLLRTADGEYGVWSMQQDEVAAVAGFLISQHAARDGGPQVGQRAPDRLKVREQPPAPAPNVPNAAPIAPSVAALAQPQPVGDAAAAGLRQAPTSAPVPSTAPAPTCKSCRSTALIAMWGKFGYYWKCSACGANTAMPTVCAACGVGGPRSEVVRIRKAERQYIRACAACRREEVIWTTPATEA